ncbi:MAG: SGNH/GDSL hydrolase family protein [Verrucomicrobiales bacterium]|nr:SGNH/GDSL hydrolase family protein [Verrucomicrobiales bacterium]
MPRRFLLRWPRPLAVLALSLLAGSSSSLAADDAVRWTDVRTLGVEGQGWRETEAPFDRLPAKAHGRVRDAVWDLSHHSAGLHVRFVTDATRIHARWSLTSETLAMFHMPATGVSGVDLYVKTPSGVWRWLAIGRPDRSTNETVLVRDLPRESREYLLYLPLYNGTRSLEIGVPEDARCVPAGPWGPGTRKPMVFYGTSILHGACASRPGMPHAALLGRRFQFPHINLGFSGNGKMEPEMADLIAELDASVFVLDCLPNMNASEVTERLEPFVRRLRAAHPRTPILLVEDRSYADAFLVSAKRERNETSREALRAAYRRLRAERVPHLHYLGGDDLLGTDGEGTVDSSHPNDLGFVRQADAHARILGPILRRAARERTGR